ncbi:MAG: 50S ribosomal protein L11 methyltransferase [Syntrophomonadaceae bacterium]|nr:50S ribosomal protein L11 methyltransferase [Syntrophomonadaceae bacterium]
MAEPQCVDALAELFHQIGCGGVVMEDPFSARRHIANGDWDGYELPSDFIEREHVVVKAYFPQERDISQALTTGLKQVETSFGTSCRLSVEDVYEESWADSWKEYYHTIRIGERLVIKPSWEEFTAASDDVVIELDPGMAFGTGLHATTRFCLELMEKRMQGGEKVVDVGTGSGILAISAARLGAAQVTAIDVDEVAVQAARKNVVRNRVEGQVTVLNLNFNHMYENESVDLIIANLTAELVVEILPRVNRMLSPGGQFIASGIVADKWFLVEDALRKNGLLLQERLQDQDWLGIAIRKG